MKNLNNKLQALNENRGETELKDYVLQEAENDPNFFRWIFDEDFENDFDSSLSDEQKEQYGEFLNSL